MSGDSRKNPQGRVEVARDLIKQGHLRAARDILVTIDHPKAREWIDQIDHRLAQQEANRQAQFTFVRTLIQQQRIQEARTYLIEMNDPDAAPWIQAIDSGAYTVPQQNLDQKRLPRSGPPSAGRSCLRTIGTLLLMATLVIVALSLLPNVISNRAPSNTGQFRPANTTSCGIDIASIGANSANSLTSPSEIRTRISQLVGSVASLSTFDTATDSNGRWDITVEFNMLSGQANRACALRAMEAAARVFGEEISPTQTGRLYALASWRVGDQLCTDNLGIGYRVAQSIDWNSANQQSIFNAIDRNEYGDTGAPYMTAFAPDPSIFSQCNR